MASIGIGKFDTDDEEVNNDPPVEAKRPRWPLLAAVAALLLALSGGVYYWTTSRPAEVADPAGAAKTLVDVPAMVISLRTSAGRTHLLKLHVMLVAAGPKSVEPVRAKLPLYVDTLQPFLHELRPEDLNGSAAIFRVKEELLSRATITFGDGVIRDVLIQDLIEQ